MLIKVNLWMRRKWCYLAHVRLMSPLEEITHTVNAFSKPRRDQEKFVFIMITSYLDLQDSNKIIKHIPQIFISFVIYVCLFVATCDTVICLVKFGQFCID